MSLKLVAYEGEVFLLTGGRRQAKSKHSKPERLALGTHFDLIIYTMNAITNFAWRFSANARRKRAALFRTLFRVDASTRILDLGSENGSNILRVLEGTDFRPENVYIADIDPKAIDEGNRNYGFTPVLINADEPLPFADKFFDIVYCSSVIEHVTVPKAELWDHKGGKEFARAAMERQREFAREITRLGRKYFVQTPARSFPIESHTWLPLVGYLPRRMFLPILKASNRFWVKAADPDFNLLGKKDMQELFPDAKILEETKLGLTKSIMAVKL